MGITKWVVVMVASLAVVLAGCNKEGGSVDTSGVEKAFSSSPPDVKTSADGIVFSVKNGDYSGAMAKIKSLPSTLTPEQQQSIKDLLMQLQTKVTDAASKASSDAQKAVGDVQKSLTK